MGGQIVMSYTKYIEEQIKNIALNEEIHIFTTRTARELYPIIYKISKRKTQKLLIKENKETCDISVLRKPFFDGCLF
jgi:Ulp1 family protease